MDEVRWLSAEEQRAWRAYLDSTRLLMQRLDQQLQRDAGMSLTDYELLVTLDEAPGRRMRMSSLADATMASRSGVTRAINRLVALGWVTRRPCPDDRRGQLAELTEAGRRKLVETSPGHVTEVREHLFDCLSPRDVDRVGQVFGEVREHLVHGGVAAVRQ
jgi:DNA-binding MarR family transcriptional regulator